MNRKIETFLIAAAFSAAGCGPSSEGPISSEGKVDEQKAPVWISSTVWPNGNVPFCYYDGADDDTCAQIPGCPVGQSHPMNSSDPAFAATLARVRYYVETSWGRIANINFNNWPVCNGTGTALDGKVVLKIFPGFGGAVRFPFGRTEIRVGTGAAAIRHEFGHALGFGDETSHPQWTSCTALGPATSQPTVGDPDSLMAHSYCQWNGWFDSLDMVAIKSLYGRKRSWQVFGDYDGDGKADLVTWSPNTGFWHTTRQSPYDAANYPDRGWGIAPDVPVPGDYDGDGLTDIAIWRPSNGGWYIRSTRTWDQVEQTPGKDIPAWAWGIPGDIPMPGDYDGDGKFDRVIVRPGNPLTWAFAYAAGGLYSVNYGDNGDVPVARDYDGDGKYDMSVWRPSTHTWFTHLSGGGDVAQPNFGSVGDVAVPGDYDNDGKADMAIWHPADGSWWVIKSGGGNHTGYGWGQPGDVPMAIDYTGDGRADAAIYRPSEGKWYIWDMLGTGATYPGIVVGSPNDIPVLKGTQ